MQLEDWLDDLCVRFIINLPPEELESVERICFQVEEAQWFYEDFIRPLDPSLPSLSLRPFSLRIFQHCPLFSEWSADSYTAAFAEFLAYKSRVPVRGAIMLNEDMDQVVLVKGWKKGANWSFPRGKINKDEDDLDCAVREVYEETGFDIKAAGLVKEAKDMKYIEVTMREQHMRLYVFRGVPMDTHFEPRTRKEISKIDWYKLNDLPTLKKNKLQEGIGEQFANTNKFYMVAPFLVPLKKWISQQRKRDSRLSSQRFETIPAVAEEILTDYDADAADGVYPVNVPSDLPEVSESQASSMDPSLHLKQMLNIESSRGPDQRPSLSTSEVDTAKSNALLALLRKGSRPDIPDISKPNTPFDQISFPPDVPRSPPHHHHTRPPQFSTLPPPPQFPISPFAPKPGPSMSVLPPTLGAQSSIPFPSTFASGNFPSAQDGSRQQVAAPYRRTGDPDFSHSNTSPSEGHRVPPASALPPLTSHKQALLDVFRTAAPRQQPAALPPASPTHRPLHVAAPPVNGQSSHTTVPAPASFDPASMLPTLLANRIRAQNQAEKDSNIGPIGHRASLLGLFKQLPPPAAIITPISSTLEPALAPVELAASSTPGVPIEEAPSQREVLTKLLQQKSSLLPKPHSRVGNGSREGKTSATISGPLNQPQFEGIVKNSRPTNLSTDLVRSPAPLNKTLFDPNSTVQKKILTRPAGSDHSPARSARSTKPTHASSPKRPSSRKDDNSKPFQPQILRRPATEQREPSPHTIAPSDPRPLLESNAKLPVPPAVSTKPANPPLRTPPNPSTSPGLPTHPYHLPPPPPSETHKQTLLSLFGAPIHPSPTLLPPPRTPSASVSLSTTTTTTLIPPPLLPAEKHIPIQTQSTRSRLGSLASMVSTGSTGAPVPGERRQTAAGDKAFLLGYLGRIASQET